MPKLIVSHASCSDVVIQKLKVASQMLLAYDVEPTIKKWEGLRTNILVAVPDNPYGLKVINLALTHNIPILLVTFNQNKFSALFNSEGIVAWINPNKPAASFEKKLESLLYNSNHRVFTETLEKTNESINRLLKQQTLSTIRFNTHTLLIDQTKGICCAQTESDARSIAIAIQTNAKLQISAIKHSELEEFRYFSSVENFFFSVFINMQALPKFTHSSAQLSAWPNINSPQHSAQIARISNLLISDNIEVKQLNRIASPHLVSAFLLSTTLAKILTRKESHESIRKIKKTRTDKKHFLNGFLEWIGMPI